MEIQALTSVLELALKKSALFQQSVLRYIMRSIMAGMFIGIGVVVAFRTGQFFFATESPAATPLAALTFSVAIILILFGGGDLFTGNTFYYFFAILRRKMNIGRFTILCTTTFVGNFIGVCIFGGIIYFSGIFHDLASSTFLMSAVEKKMALSMSEVFFRGILCNWLICLAFFLPIMMKENAAKILLMILMIFAFFISGYEHCIANMGSFIIALFSPHGDAVTWSGFVHNLIPATLGNLVGGILFTACVYYYLNKPALED